MGGVIAFGVALFCFCACWCLWLHRREMRRWTLPMTWPNRGPAFALFGTFRTSLLGANDAFAATPEANSPTRSIHGEAESLADRWYQTAAFSDANPIHALTPTDDQQTQSTALVISIHTTQVIQNKDKDAAGVLISSTTSV
jgi:hypothetical protein